MVKTLATKAGFDEVLKDDKLVVVDFTATMCKNCSDVRGACSWADQKADVATLVKVDVDENEETGQACEVEAMPTFQFYKGGQKIHEIRGGNIDEIVAKIEELK